MEGPAFVSLLAVTPAHLLVSQEAWKRVGNGFCPRSSQPAPADRIALYRDAQMPFDADSDRDALVEETAFSTWTAVSRTTTPRVCWTYREVAPGIYESRSFDPEGKIGRAQGCTPVTTAQLVCRYLLEKQNNTP